MKARSQSLLIGALLLALGSGCAARDEGPMVTTANGVRPSGAPATGAGNAPGDRLEQLRQFAQCMRDKGRQRARPGPDTALGSAAGMGEGIDRNDPQVRKAYGECQSKLPNAGQPPKLDPRQVELYRVFAQCIRDHGYSAIVDPAPDGTLQFSALRALRDPAFRTALEACRGTLTGLLPSQSPRSSGGSS